MAVKIYINGRYLTQEITGVQRYSHLLMESIDARSDFHGRYAVTLLVPSRGLRFSPEYRNIRVRAVGRFGGHAWEQLELPRYSNDGLLFCPGNTAPAYRLALGRPTVVTVHSLCHKAVPQAYTRSFRLLYNMLVPAILRWSQAVITVSASEAQTILAQYPSVRERLAVIQNGGFGDGLTPMVHATEPKKVGFPYGLYVGSLSKAKNFPALLQAAIATLRETGVGFAFVGGTQVALRRMSVELPSDVKGKLIFTGQVDDSTELISWYKGAAFMAFPSLYEASSLPPIEAMSCGCPVIASSIASLRERCGPAALYCDPYSVHDIAAAMVKVVRDQGLRADLISLGLQRAAELSWARCAEATLGVLEGVAGNTRGVLK